MYLAGGAPSSVHDRLSGPPPLPCLLQAVCNHSGVKVVLKVYSLSRVAENALHTLVREVRIHMNLAHDNIIMMYAVFEVCTA